MNNFSKRYLLRDEPFGYTFYDKDKLNHQFILKKELNSFLNKTNININDCEYLKAKRKDYRKDIVYSPIRIYYELTLACNLNCKSCFNCSGEPRRYELSTKEVIDSLKHLKKI